MIQHLKQAVAGAQILFVAFGALVLVPLLTGLNPAMALLGGGIGTLLFQLCTGRKVPIFLGSSFAFIAPIIYATQTWGLPSTMFGLFAAGFMYFVFAALVRWRGVGAVNKLLPPVVIGPVIMIIGLSVATVASNMAMGRAGGEQQEVVFERATVAEQHSRRSRLDRDHVFHQHGAVALPAQDVAKRRGDVRRRQAGGGDLVEKRLEQVMVAAIEQGDAHRRRRQRACGPQAGETAADDDHVGKRSFAHACIVAGSCKR